MEYSDKYWIAGIVSILLSIVVMDDFFKWIILVIFGWVLIIAYFFIDNSSEKLKSLERRLEYRKFELTMARLDELEEQIFNKHGKRTP